MVVAGCVVVVDGVDGAPVGGGAGVGRIGACARATPLTHTSVKQAAVRRSIRLSVFGTRSTVKL